MPSCGRQAYATGLVRLFEFFDQGGDDFEDVAYYAVIGYLEDGCVLIFINGGYGAGAFHAYYVLDGAADAESEIELGRDSLAGAADLAIHGEPAFVADGARGAQFAAHGVREFFGQRNIFGSFDAAADTDEDGALREVDGLLGFAEKFAGLGADLLGLQLDGGGLHRSFAAGVFFREVSAKGAGPQAVYWLVNSDMRPDSNQADWSNQKSLTVQCDWLWSIASTASSRAL